jgi:hypothetical protein
MHYPFSSNYQTQLVPSADAYGDSLNPDFLPIGFRKSSALRTSATSLTSAYALRLNLQPSQELIG